MNDRPQVVTFPKVRKRTKPTTDSEHVANVKRTWKAFTRAVADARNAGLEVELGSNDIHGEPRLTRRYR